MEIGIIIALIIGGLIAFSIYTTLFSNPRIAGNGFFEKYLKKYGVNPQELPITLKDELIQIAVQTTDQAFGTSETNRTSRLKWNSEFQNQLDIHAIVLASYLKNPQEKFRQMWNEPLGGSTSVEVFIDCYERHGLQ